MNGLDDQQENGAREVALQERIGELERERASHREATEKLTQRIEILQRRLEEIRRRS